MNIKVLTDEQEAQFVADIIKYGTDFVAPLYATVAAIEQAVLQSPEIQALREALRAAAEYIGDRSAGSSRFWELYDAAMEKQP